MKYDEEFSWVIDNNYKWHFPQELVKEVEQEYPEEKETLRRLDQILYSEPRRFHVSREVYRLAQPSSEEGLFFLIYSIYMGKLVQQQTRVYSSDMSELRGTFDTMGDALSFIRMNDEGDLNPLPEIYIKIRDNK